MVAANLRDRPPEQEAEDQDEMGENRVEGRTSVDEIPRQPAHEPSKLGKTRRYVGHLGISSTLVRLSTRFSPISS
jgi:hypothetical protein